MITKIRRSGNQGNRGHGELYVWPIGENGGYNVGLSREADVILEAAGLMERTRYTFHESRLAEAIAVLRFNGYTNFEVEE